MKTYQLRVNEINPLFTPAKWRKCWLLGLFFILTACGGGGGSDSSDNNTPPKIDPPSQIQAGIIIPGLDEPNIKSPDLVVDDNGVQHAVASDIVGNVFYARCDESCDLAESWESVVMTNFEVEGFFSSSIVPKLQVTSNNQPRVMVFRANSVLSTIPSLYFECNAVDCLNASAWSGQETFAMIGVVEYDIERSRSFTLSNDDKPRVSWLSVPELGNFLDDNQDDALFYASCENDCATTGEWTTTVAQEFNLSSATVADIVIDNTGTGHIAFLEQIVGSNTIDITYLSCVALCDSSAPAWGSPVVLSTREQDLSELLSLRLFLTPSGEPALALYDPESTGDDPLTLFTCVGDCNTQAGWQSTVPVNLASFVGEDIVSFGNGLDATSIDGDLTLQFTAKRRNDLFPSLLYQASCNSECNRLPNWSITKMADASTIPYSDVGICQFVGTEIGGPTTIASAAFSYVIAPIWFCGDYDYIEIDESGNRELISAADIRFFEIAIVTQLPQP